MPCTCLKTRYAWSSTPLIGYGYLLLIGAALAAAVVLITVPGPRAWGLADLVAFGAAVAYVLSRTTGVPTDSLDIGNWNCSLGTAALSAEAMVVLLAGWRMQVQRPVRGFEQALPAGGTEHTVSRRDGRYVVRENSR